VAITGVSGRIAHGYFIAAVVGPYTVTKTEELGWRLAATLAEIDPYALAQRPLTFVAAGACWPIERFEIINGSFTATLGTPSEDD